MAIVSYSSPHLSWFHRGSDIANWTVPTQGEGLAPACCSHYSIVLATSPKGVAAFPVTVTRDQ